MMINFYISVIGGFYVMFLIATLPNDNILLSGPTFLLGNYLIAFLFSTVDTRKRYFKEYLRRHKQDLDI